jgi:hypothetical protein
MSNHERFRTFIHGLRRLALALAHRRRGGLKGGRARADRMTAEERSESARKAGQARWKKKTAANADQ